VKRPLVTLLAGAWLFAGSAQAETPCDFKGISVGDKMTAAEVMNTLGVAKYKANSKRPSWKETDQIA